MNVPTAAKTIDPTSQVSFTALRGLTVADARAVIRAGRYDGQTAGLGLGHLQGNVAILPAGHALDFFRFCQRNPKPCPLVGVSDAGDSTLAMLGNDIDICTDVPLYNVYRDGELAEQRTDITDLWRDDLTAFVLGCSFTFEEALMAEGIRLRHIDEGRTVPMFRTNLETKPAGPFGGPVVVSMRPLGPVDAIRACVITARFPHAHGEPIHIGDPSAIGIDRLDRPDWGDATDIRDGELAVFWACGVTPQAAIQSAKPPICITHAPGRMLITDIASWDRTGRGRQP